jgi:DNA (cytosine-5)-methyltransferase 1
VNYYNEFDPYAAQWLRNLIAAHLIPDGVVDDRSITEVRPDDLAAYTQCHFFAGIAGWSYALQLADWPASRPVWTGSCPCQPFSCAGKRKGTADSRHLWPEFYRLIKKCRPTTIFGEQVASKDGLQWLDGVFADLEGAGYACGAVCLPACAKGAVHARSRLFWIANARGQRLPGPIDQDGLLSGKAAAPTRFSDTLADARRALAENLISILSCDGVSLAVERCALKAYGNAIVPQVAAEFIKACMEVMP